MRHEDLYQCLMAFVEDTLLRRDGGISYHNQVITEDEELFPSLENFVVLTWLRLIHSGLSGLIKQRYGTELRSRTLASIKPEISQALDSLLDELHTAEDAKSLRTVTSRLQASCPASFPSSKPRQVLLGTHSINLTKSCPLCKQVCHTDYSHFLS